MDTALISFLLHGHSITPATQYGNMGCDLCTFISVLCGGMVQKKNKNCIGSTELRVQPTSKVFLFAHSLLFVTFVCVNVLRVGLT